ncbi:MAG: RsmE family RNA methyltransferase [Polyangiaceae bacterium]|nr:RsmE family RNA methyltransferase [Polyangiaceae bacterium]
MSRLRVPCSDLREGRLTLAADEGRYVARVHRLDRGADVLLFDAARGVECDAVVMEVRPRVVVAAGPPRPAPVLGLPLTLVLGVAKGEKVDDVLRAATALGAARVLVAATARSVPRVASPGARERRWETIAVQAARQSGRGDVPIVAGPAPLAAALAEVPESAEWRVALAPTARQSLAAALVRLRAGEGAAVFVGPEGGLEPGELALAAAHRFTPVSLGPLVLRAELAAVAALAATACALRG